MYKQGNWKVWFVAGFCAYCAAGIAYYVGRFVSNSNCAGGMLALMTMVGVFFLIATRANGSVADVKFPAAILLQLSPLRALSEVKDCLAGKYFGDRRWSLENLNEQKGQATFVFRQPRHDIHLSPGELAKYAQAKERIIILTVRTQQLSRATTVSLNYEVGGDTLTHHAALELCASTTEHVRQHLLTACFDAVST